MSHSHTRLTCRASPMTVRSCTRAHRWSPQPAFFFLLQSEHAVRSQQSSVGTPSHDIAACLALHSTVLPCHWRSTCTQHCSRGSAEVCCSCGRSSTQERHAHSWCANTRAPPNNNNNNNNNNSNLQHAHWNSTRVAVMRNMSTQCTCINSSANHTAVHRPTGLSSNSTPSNQPRTSQHRAIHRVSLPRTRDDTSLTDEADARVSSYPRTRLSRRVSRLVTERSLHQRHDHKVLQPRHEALARGAALRHDTASTWAQHFVCLPRPRH
jgi:hypothetical protein